MALESEIWEKLAGWYYSECWQLMKKLKRRTNSLRFSIRDNNQRTICTRYLTVIKLNVYDVSHLQFEWELRIWNLSNQHFYTDNSCCHVLHKKVYFTSFELNWVDNTEINKITKKPVYLFTPFCILVFSILFPTAHKIIKFVHSSWPDIISGF